MSTEGTSEDLTPEILARAQRDVGDKQARTKARIRDLEELLGVLDEKFRMLDQLAQVVEREARLEGGITSAAPSETPESLLPPVSENSATSGDADEEPPYAVPVEEASTLDPDADDNIEVKIHDLDDADASDDSQLYSSPSSDVDEEAFTDKGADVLAHESDDDPFVDNESAFGS